MSYNTRRTFLAGSGALFTLSYLNKSAFAQSEQKTMMHNIPDYSLFEKMVNVIKETALPYFRKKVEVENKEYAGFDPVTIADKEIELALRKVIAENRPDDSILGEEFSSIEGNSGYTWVIDPIDGTRSFISGLPVWGSLVGLTYHGDAVAGMMVQPFTDEVYYTLGEGAFLICDTHHQKSRLKTSNCMKVEDSILFSTSPSLFSGQSLDKFDKISKLSKMTRFGTDCYAYAMLALGFVDTVIEAGLKPYDVMALIPIIEQAGGVITTWEGEAAENAGSIVASATPDLHKNILSLLNG